MFFELRNEDECGADLDLFLVCVYVVYLLTVFSVCVIRLVDD